MIDLLTTSDIREILLATGDARIVKHTENDAYWGDGGDGSGENRLGDLDACPGGVTVNAHNCRSSS
jgi:predicted NAD-dependent protein-ADP-ribosyltransferase YbiA (DUF1768 family)